MKNKLVTFQKPVKVFQVFTNTNFYTKAERSLLLRKKDLTWEVHQSLSGYVSNGELHLNEKIEDNPNFKSCNLITLNDNHNRNLFDGRKYSFWEIPEAYRIHNECYHFAGSININNDIELRNADNLELHLLPTNYQFPKQNTFKLCDVEINTPVEIKLNSKFDFSGSRRTARIFIECRYIIEYLGTFDNCIIERPPMTPTAKKIPHNTKLINLTKPLW